MRRIDESLRQRAGGTATGLGTGGMVTKLQAADIARQAGADVVIAAGREPDVIVACGAGDAVGTRFPPPDESASRAASSGFWPAPSASGRIVVDAGAADAVLRHGRSLLPAGIRGVEGDFNRGDTVLVVGLRRHEAGARSSLAYTAATCATIAGCKSHEIEQRLGFAYGNVAMHATT